MKDWIIAAVLGALLATGCGSTSSASDASDAGVDRADVGVEGSVADANASACTANLQSDSANCGACGHDCLGGLCTAGKCQPVALAVGINGTETVSCFAVDGTSIYYSFKTNTGADEIDKIPVGGGTPSRVVAGESGCPMFVSNGSLYWLNAAGTTLRTVNVNGGSPATAASWTSADAALGPLGKPLVRIQTDGTLIYWVAATADAGVAGGALKKVALSGGTPATIATGTADFHVMAMDSAFVYWLDGGLKKVPKGGGAPTLLGMPASAATIASLAVDANAVYWIDEYNMWKVPIAGGVPMLFAPASRPIDMIIDSGAAYLCDSNGVHAVALATGRAAGLASGVCASGLADDARAVYWTSGNAIIHRMAK